MTATVPVSAARPVPLHKSVPFLGVLTEIAPDPIGFVLNMARQYGDIVHYNFRGHDSYQLNHPDLIRDALIEHGDAFEKAATDRAIFAQSMGEGLLNTEGDTHRQHRKLAQPAFHHKRIDAYTQTMIDYTARMIDETWRDGTMLDLHMAMTRLTMEIVSKSLYSVDVHHESNEVGEAVERINHLGGIEFRVGVALPMWLPIPPIRQAKLDRATIDRLLLPIIRVRRESGEDTGDLLSMLLLSRDENGEGMSDKEVRDEVVTLFIAGHETTSNALTWALRLLAENPAAAEMLHDEIVRVIGDRQPTLEDFRAMPYLDSVIKESMRLYPPAWILNTRLAMRDVEIGGFPIPKDSYVIISPYVMHRDPAYFPEPERFLPERWAGDFEKHLPKFAYFPFGGGVRVCIGNQFAMLEQRLVLAMIVRDWRLTLDAARPPVVEPAVTLRPHDGLWMLLHAR